jgi:hypothetical protein
MSNNTLKKGYWNGELAKYRVVNIMVGDEPQDLKLSIESHNKRFLWFEPFIGTIRQVVEVHYGSQKFYLDNEDGTGYLKVTSGMGSPAYGHKSIYPKSILGNTLMGFIKTKVDRERLLSDQKSIDEYFDAKDHLGYLEHKNTIKSLKETIIMMRLGNYGAGKTTLF